MKNFAVIALLIGTGTVPALADVDFSWTFGDTTTPTVPYGTGTFDATLVNGTLYPGLYQIVSGTGTITDSTGTYSVSVASLSANYDGGDQGVCTGSGTGNFVADPSAVCNTVRDVPGDGNYTFDNLIYTGASLAGGNPFDANGIGFIGGGKYFLLTTSEYSGNGGSPQYCGPQSPGCSNLNTSLSVMSTPDGGMTLAFLGLAVAGLAGLRRKLSI